MPQPGLKLEYANRYGRKQTRGIRPWLLIPKLVVVAIHFGALFTLLVLWLMPQQPAGRYILTVFSVTRPIVLRVVVPSLVVAMLLGVALLLQHPQQFMRMRWLRVKIALAMLYVPAAHLFLSSRLGMVRESLRANRGLEADPWAVAQFRLGLGAAVLMVASIMILGRLKPRLGQNWARHYAPPEPTREAAQG